MTKQEKIFDAAPYDEFSMLLPRYFGTEPNGIIAENIPPYIMLTVDASDTRRYDLRSDKGTFATTDYDLPALRGGVTEWTEISVGSDPFICGFLRGFPVLRRGDKTVHTVQLYKNYHNILDTAVAVPISAVDQIHRYPQPFAELLIEQQLIESGFKEVSDHFTATVPHLKRANGELLQRPATAEDIEEAIKFLNFQPDEIVNCGLGTVASRFVQPSRQL